MQTAWKRINKICYYEERHLFGCDAVGLLRSDVSEERIALIIRVKRISELGTMSAVVPINVSSLSSVTDLLYFGVSIRASLEN
jgi:hypothetical protein